MVLAYLVLAHFFADFIIQPGNLVKWKENSNWGLFIHVLMHFITGVVFLMPLIILGHLELIIAVFALSILHFGIDLAKITYIKRNKRMVAPFLMDQFIHIMSILMIFLFIVDMTIIMPENIFYEVYQNKTLIIFFILAVFIGKVFDIYHLQEKLEKAKRRGKIEKKR